MIKKLKSPVGKLITVLETRLGKAYWTQPQVQRSVRTLSRAFTQDRDQLDAEYMIQNLPAYLAYYVPLNFSKLHSLLRRSPQAFQPSGNGETSTNQPLRWIDYGCGPGTAALAALAAYRDTPMQSSERRTIDIHLVDLLPRVVSEATQLIETFAEHLHLQVRVHAHSLIQSALSRGPFDLVLASNVLNEHAKSGQNTQHDLFTLWNHTAGSLFLLEPGHRVSSQQLVRWRERLLAIDKPFHFIAPCTHADTCPVYRTKHWCHFSDPLADADMIQLNRAFFQNPRLWLKYSYLWIRAQAPALTARPSSVPGVFRAIGDLHQSGPHHLAIDLCQPKSKRVLRIPRRSAPVVQRQLVRGALVSLNAQGDLANARLGGPHNATGASRGTGPAAEKRALPRPFYKGPPRKGPAGSRLRTSGKAG